VSEDRGELDEANCSVREPEGHDVPEDDGEARLVELSSATRVQVLRNGDRLFEFEPLRDSFFEAGLSDEESVLLGLSI
jgi:hypothetical protein